MRKELVTIKVGSREWTGVDQESVRVSDEAGMCIRFTRSNWFDSFAVYPGGNDTIVIQRLDAEKFANKRKATP